MTTREAKVGQDQRLDLIDALIYADAFDCAVTLDELWRYSRAAIDRDALRERLAKDATLRRIVLQRDGLVCLADRSHLIDERLPRIQRAHKLLRRTRRVVRVLRHLPFVRAVALTGSVAAEDAAEKADVDLLVVVAPERLGISFLLLGTASRLLGRRLFCPNYYISEGRLPLVPANAYVARELAQVRGLIGHPEPVRAANPWLQEMFPNAVEPSAGDRMPVRGGRRLQRVLEAPLGGAWGDRVERGARRIASARLRAHYGELGREVPADVSASFVEGTSLRFHARFTEETVLERYAARRGEVARWLDEVDRDPAILPNTAV